MAKSKKAAKKKAGSKAKAAKKTLVVSAANRIEARRLLRAHLREANAGASERRQAIKELRK